MHVLFVEPAFPRNQREFVRALHKIGAQVTGIGEAAVEHLDDELKSWMQGYEQVRSVVHEESVLDAVRRCQKRGWVDHLEATVEAHIMSTAHVREATGIPGTSVQTSFLCRDKPAMKEALRQAGVPCAQSDGVTTPDEVRAFIERVGYPIIVKPRAAAGASGTFKISGPDDIDRVVEEAGISRGAGAAVEEFIEGHEGFYDTLCLRGEVVHEFVTHYYPNVLEAMRERWISPVFITTNRSDAPGYDEVKQLGADVIRALDIRTSPTHMEWFYGPKGLNFSEIGCRPPGVGAWDLYCAANEIDLYEDWARVVTGNPPRQRPSRRYSAALINLRPDRDGRISGYSGLELLEELSPCIIDSHLPPPGTATQPVEAGYMANAWVRMRHPDYDELRAILERVGRTVKVWAR
ncbi:MAG: ATP-grasp domain-containing protein [bacterium]|nr:ATP-grasp domain-containing protein [bacterium]